MAHLDSETEKELLRLESELSDEFVSKGKVSQENLSNLHLQELEAEIEADLGQSKPLFEQPSTERFVSKDVEVFSEPKKVLDIREFRGREYIDLLLGDDADKKVEFVAKSNENDFNFGKTYDFSRAVCSQWPKFDYEKLDKELISTHKANEIELEALEKELIVPAKPNEWPSVAIKGSEKEIEEATKLMRKLTHLDKTDVKNQAHSNLFECNFSYNPEEIVLDDEELRSELGSLADLLENSRKEEVLEAKAKGRRAKRILNWVKGKKSKNLAATRNLRTGDSFRTGKSSNSSKSGFKELDLDDIPPPNEWKVKYAPHEAFVARRNLRDYVKNL